MCHRTLHVSFLFDEAAVLDVTIKKSFCICGGGHFCVSISL